MNCSTRYPSVGSVVKVMLETLNGVTGGWRMGRYLLPWFGRSGLGSPVRQLFTMYGYASVT